MKQSYLTIDKQAMNPCAMLAESSIKSMAARKQQISNMRFIYPL